MLNTSWLPTSGRHRRTVVSIVLSTVFTSLVVQTVLAAEQGEIQGDPSGRATQALKAAMSASVRFTDPDGHALKVIPRDTNFQVEVTLENLMGSEPPAGLFLNGWLRPQSLRNLSCVEAARNYLATQRVPIGSIDLNGPAIGVLAEDGAFTIVDPDLNLASANMIGATTFDKLPVEVVADPAQARFLVALEGAQTGSGASDISASPASTGSVQSVTVFGAAKEVLLDGLDHPASLLPDGIGGFWILEKGRGRVTRVDPAGQVAWQQDLAASALRADAAGSSLLVMSDNQLRLLDLVTGEQRVRFDSTVPELDQSLGEADQDAAVTGAVEVLRDAVPLSNETGVFAIAVLIRDRLQIYYLDDVDAPVEIDLADEATTLKTDNDGMFVFAYSAQGGATSIVDVARSHLAQVIGSHPTVADIEFAGRAAFLMLADQTLAGVIDLASIRYGKHAQVREVSLGAADNSLRNVSGLMTPLLPSNSMLVVHAASFTGFSVEDSSTMGDSPPMSAIRLRGGVPHRVESLDRSFREVEPGVFVASARIAQEGPFELVITTGIGSVTACFPVPTETDSQTSIRVPGQMRLTSDPDNPQQQRLRLLDANGIPIRGVQAEVTFSALESHWRKNDSLTTDERGMSVEDYDLPPLGTYVVTVRSGDNNQFQPLMVEIRQ